MRLPATRESVHVFYKCPLTKLKVDLCIATDVASLAAHWHRKEKRKCPHCNAVHEIDFTEAFLDGVIDESALHGEPMNLRGRVPTA